jgi:hypothetical protein
LQRTKLKEVIPLDTDAVSDLCGLFYIFLNRVIVTIVFIPLLSAHPIQSQKIIKFDRNHGNLKSWKKKPSKQLRDCHRIALLVVKRARATSVFSSFFLYLF